MKILVLHSELGVLCGGGEYFTRNLFAEFVKRGHQVTAVFVADLKGRYAYHIPATIEPIALPGWWSRKFGQTTLSNIGNFFSNDNWLKPFWNRGQEALCWRTIRWHARRFQSRVMRQFANQWKEFDAVYVHGDPYLAKNVAVFRPTLLMLPGPVSPELEPVLRKINVVCAHDDALNRIRNFLGDHIMELPLGIRSDLFVPDTTSVRSQIGWSNNDLVLGYVGRLTHLKGVDLLAAAFNQLLDTVSTMKLLIVGSGDMEGHLRSTLADGLRRGSVHFESALPQEQLPPWYRAMNLMVMPSRYETMSSAVLEGMACGVPFLASDVGGNSVLGKTGAGWLFQGGSVSSLSKSLASILKNPAEMVARGQCGPKFIRERHSWAASAERLEQILVLRLGMLRGES